jgi:hypothetical protein
MWGVVRDDNWADHFAGLPGSTVNDGKEAWHILRGGHRDRRVDAFHYFYKSERRDSADNRMQVRPRPGE